MLKVIDVSGWQQGLNYDTAVGRGVEGVIVKITEGTSIEDTWWSHISECDTRELPWGVYCYSHATTPEEAREEANEVLYLLGNNVPEFGVWFDFEAPECLDAYDPTAICSAFVSKINEAGILCGIYASLNTLVNIVDVRAFADYVPYWVAQYNSTCDFKAYYPDNLLAGWQYSDTFNIGGMNVDVNEWYL